MHEFYSRYFRNNNVTTDSRDVKSGDIFIALKGDSFDGNKYAQQALDAGAKVAVIDNEKYKKQGDKLLFVKNSLGFLQELAKFHRRQIAIPIIGITGTNGKTTTKELIRNVLAEKYACAATQGNFNNHIGVPLTLLSFNESLDVGIVEMGANHVGEIAELCSIAEPDSGLITNIGMAHLEGFGSLEGVIKAKSELYEYLKTKQGKIYVNGNDRLLLSLIDNYKNIVVYNDKTGDCSSNIKTSYPALEIEFKSGEFVIDVKSKLHGEYNLTNIMAAACIGIDIGVPIARIVSGIESYSPDNNRSERLTYGSNLFIFDCYNANPTSMQVAIESFSKLPAEKKILVLGEMKELGEYSNEEHQKIAELINKYSFEAIFLVGDGFMTVNLNGAIKLSHVSELENYFRGKALKNTAILVKGSRVNKLEQLKKHLPPSG